VSSLYKHAINGHLNQTSIESDEFKSLFKKTLDLAINPHASLNLKNTMLKNLPKLINCLDPVKYGTDQEI
jgi:hypothetical protein